MQHLLIGSPPGWKRTSLTAPLCPGSLFNSFPLATSHIATLLSPLPAAIFLPFESQLARNKFFSNPVGAPSYVRIARSAGAKGRISHVRTVESCAFERRYWESGDTCREVMVSVCPIRAYATAFFRRSHTLISLSMPPE
jgi:hypothetical protein